MSKQPCLCIYFVMISWTRVHLICHSILSFEALTYIPMGWCDPREQLSQTLSMTSCSGLLCLYAVISLIFAQRGDDTVLDEVRPPVQLAPFICQSEESMNWFYALLLIVLLFLHCLLCTVTLGQSRDAVSHFESRTALDHNHKHSGFVLTILLQKGYKT